MKDEHNLPIELDEEATKAATAVEEATQTRVRVVERPKGQRDHVVIVWNDDEHTEVFVMTVLMEVCKMSKEEAFKTVMQIHEEGKAPVWRGMLEHCELKREQIATFRDRLVVELGGPSIPLNVTVVEA